MADKRIQEDLAQVQNMITLILSGKQHNFIVLDPDYLNPTIRAPKGNRDLPIDAPEGMLMYYKGMRDALEFALNGRRIPKSKMPLRAPQYILDLAEDK
jgi:hypothetical protein